MSEALNSRAHNLKLVISRLKRLVESNGSVNREENIRRVGHESPTLARFGSPTIAC